MALMMLKGLQNRARFDATSSEIAQLARQ